MLKSLYRQDLSWNIKKIKDINKLGWLLFINYLFLDVLIVNKVNNILKFIIHHF